MKAWLVACVVVASMAYADNGGMLTLDSAIAIGRQNSRALRISAAKVDAAEARAGEARTALYPSLRFYGAYVRLQELPFRLVPTSLPVPFTVGNVPPNSYAFRLGVQQPLFTGFRLGENARAAEYQAEASTRELQMDDADLVLSVTTAYWTLYQAIQTNSFADENVGRLESYVRDTERLLGVGLATRNDLLKMQVQLANARIAQIDARNEMRLAAMNLNNIIGRPLETDVTPASDPGSLIALDSAALRGTARGSLDTLIARAWESRQDLQAVGYRTEAARAGVAAVKGGYWPQIDLSANYNYNNPNTRYQPITPEFLGGWDIGVQLQFDVWSWGKTARQAEQAEAALKQSEQQQEQLKENIALEIQRASLSLRRSREKLDVAQLATEQAGENRRTTNDKYTNGLTTSTELLDAEVALIQAKTNLTGAMVEYALARARLARAVGELGGKRG